MKTGAAKAEAEKVYGVWGEASSKASAGQGAGERAGRDPAAAEAEVGRLDILLVRGSDHDLAEEK